MTDHIDPTRESFGRFKDLPRDEPIHMINLVRLRARPVYPEDYTGPRAATGAEGYAAYGAGSGPVLRRLGGRIVWSGAPQLMLIGAEVEAWDIAFIAEYPDGQAFIDMIRDPEYRAAVVHRTASVADSRLIRTRPRPAGEGFG